MTADLAAAWEWYQATRRVAWTVRTLGEQYWDGLPPDLPMFRRDKLKLSGGRLAGLATTADGLLADLAILLLFAAFEAALRSRADAEVGAELAADPPRPAVVRGALLELRGAIREGSAAKVLAAYKPLDHGLVEEVVRVRRHRNWVAHGRGSRLKSPTTPEAAYDCLTRFLKALDRRAAGPPPQPPATAN